MRLRAEPGRGSSARRRGRSPGGGGPRPRSYGWVVVLAALVLVGWLGIRALTKPSVAHGIPPGERLPPFALPLATSKLGGDANLATRANAGEGSNARTPACEVDLPGSVNLCRAAGGAPIVLVFFSAGDGESVRQVEAAQRVAGRLPRVRFLAIALGGDRAKLRSLVRARGWRIPVGYDHLGDVAARYGIPVVPALTFAARGRISRGTVYHPLGAAALERRARELLRR